MAKTDAQRRKTAEDKERAKGRAQRKRWAHREDWPEIDRYIERLNRARENGRETMISSDLYLESGSPEAGESTEAQCSVYNRALDILFEHEGGKLPEDAAMQLANGLFDTTHWAEDDATPETVVDRWMNGIR